MSGDRPRAARLSRLLEVQARRRQVEEWRLAELQREARDLAGAGVAILQSLGDQSLLHGLFLDAKAAALKRNEAKAVVNRARQGEAEARLRAAHGVEKRLERASGAAKAVEQRLAERDDLDEAIEAHLAAARTSLE